MDRSSKPNAGKTKTNASLQNENPSKLPCLLDERGWSEVDRNVYDIFGPINKFPWSSSKVSEKIEELRKMPKGFCKIMI